MNPLYQKALDVLPEPLADQLEVANEKARELKEEMGITDTELNALTETAKPILTSADQALENLSLLPLQSRRAQEESKAKDKKKKSTMSTTPRHIPDPVQNKKDKERELSEGIRSASQSGLLYSDPTLDRPANEFKLKEQHNLTEALFPQLTEALGKEPGYWKAMGVYREESPEEQLEDIPLPTPGVNPPMKLTHEESGLEVKIDNPSYWQTPRGQARANLQQNIKVAKAELESLMGERKRIVDSSIVIRKTAEAMVGIDPPPMSQLNECSDLLRQSELALENDDIERASKIYIEASRMCREIGWLFGDNYLVRSATTILTG